MNATKWRLMDIVEGVLRKEIASFRIKVGRKVESSISQWLYIEPVRPGALKLVIHSYETSLDLFVGESGSPFELSLDSDQDRADLEGLLRAAADGTIQIEEVRALVGWRPNRVIWPGGAWVYSRTPGAFLIRLGMRKKSYMSYREAGGQS